MRKLNEMVKVHLGFSSRTGKVGKIRFWFSSASYTACTRKSKLRPIWLVEKWDKTTVWKKKNIEPKFQKKTCRVCTKITPHILLIARTNRRGTNQDPWVAKCSLFSSGKFLLLKRAKTYQFSNYEKTTNRISWVTDSKYHNSWVYKVRYSGMIFLVLQALKQLPSTVLNHWNTHTYAEAVSRG